MDALTALDDAYTRLIFDQTARDLLADGDWDALGFDPATRRALEHIDISELQRLGRALRRGLETGSIGGFGLRKAFPGALAHLADDGDVERVLDRFIASPELKRVDAVGLRSGVSVAEAFHDWTDGQVTDPRARGVLQHEFAAAVLTALTRTPLPGFLVKSPFIRETATGHLAVLDAARALADPGEQPDEPVLYSSAAGRYLCGPISTRVAAVLLHSVRHCPRWAADIAEALPADQADAIRTKLAERGLR